MVQITELDISLFTWDSEASLRTLSNSVRDQRLAIQTRLYRELFDMFRQKHGEGKLDMVVVWGLADEHTWLNYHPIHDRTDYPLLFDYNYEPKDAYWALIR
jgi:endo-1,4-beta-xylanase